MSAPSLPAGVGDDLPSLRAGRVDEVPIYNGHLPDPADVVQWGGKPGCLYAFVSAPKIGQYMRQGWSQIPGTTPLEVVGPKGSVDVFAVVRGKPISTADPANGIRGWFYDPAILAETGLESPYPKAPSASARATTDPAKLPKPTINR